MFNLATPIYCRFFAPKPEGLVASKSRSHFRKGLLFGFIMPNVDGHEMPEKRLPSIVKKNHYAVFFLVFGAGSLSMPD